MPSRKSGRMRPHTTPFLEMPYQVLVFPGGMSAWLKGEPSQQGGFCLWAFVSPDPGEQKGEMCVC